MTAKKFRIACHLIQYTGEEERNLVKVLREVKEAGYEGVEGLGVWSPQELVRTAVVAAGFGLHIVNVGARSIEKFVRFGEVSPAFYVPWLEKIDYDIALGNKASEVPGQLRSTWGGPEPKDDDFARAAKAIEYLTGYAKSHGVAPFMHIHERTMIETKEDADRMLAHAPDLYLLLDTGHLCATKSDPLAVIKAHGNRIAHVHLKDFYAENPKTWNHMKYKWTGNSYDGQGRFAELGKGNMGLDVAATLEALEEARYDGWISVELDRPWPHTDPFEAAKANREYLRALGY